AFRDRSGRTRSSAPLCRPVKHLEDPCAIHTCTPGLYTVLVMSSYVPAALRRHIRARFLDRCAYCLTAEALIAATFEIEHIIPRSAGGETVFDNLCLAYPTCNRYKAYRQAAVAPLPGHPAPL